MHMKGFWGHRVEKGKLHALVSKILFFHRLHSNLLCAVIKQVSENLLKIIL